MSEDAAFSKLKADALVSDLFKKAKLIKFTEALYVKVLARVRRGNPPGKEDSIGDALNWGALLTEVLDGTDIYFVSEDKDYRSQLRPSTFHEFLRSEWEDRKGSQLFFYTRISDFFKSNFPTIKIASDVEKDLAIEELGNSGSFAATHIAVKRLSKLDAFTPLQVEELVKIAISNNQVGWIITDLDVHEFYKSLLKQKNTLQADIAHQLEKLVQERLPGEDEHDTPF